MNDFLKQDDMPAGVQLLILFAFIAVSLILLGGLTVGLLAAFGLDTSVMDGGTDVFMDNILPIKMIQLVSSFVMFAFPAVAFALMKPEKLAFLKLNKGINIPSVVLAGLCMLLSYPLIAILVQMNHNIPFPESLAWFEEALQLQEAETAQVMKKFLTMDSIGALLFNVVLIALTPAICEELLFRGAIQPTLGKLVGNPHVAIVFTGALFSLIHFQFYGFFARWVLGIILGYIFYWSKNLWYPIIAHFLNNGVQVVLVYFGAIDATEAEAMPEGLGMVSIAFAIVATIFLGFMLKWYKESVESDLI